MRRFRITTIRFQGTSGKAPNAAGERCRAASPMISKRRTTASCVRWSARNCSRLMPARCCWMMRAESRMSARYALSFDINRPRGRKDGVAAIGIAAAFNGPTADQIHRAAKNFRQLELHVHPFQQTTVLVFFRGERAEQIHVAVGTKIVAQRRAKNFQPGDAAFVAKPAHGFIVVAEFHNAAATWRAWAISSLAICRI